MEHNTSVFIELDYIGKFLPTLGTIHILRMYNLGYFDPLSLYVSIFHVLKISNMDNFLTPLPPSSAYVIYEWSPRVLQTVLPSMYFIHKLG